jgi:PPM family protein phosphatase
MSSHEQSTVKLTKSERFAEKFFAPPSPPLQIQFGAATHTGFVRSNNEDHYAILKRRRTNELIRTNLPQDELVLSVDTTFGLVVADGMGGPCFGELASRLALQRMFELAEQATSWVTKFTDLEVQQIRERVKAYIQEIQSTLRKHIDANPGLIGMGTTWTSAHIMLPHVVVAHIGDSRAYLCHRGELIQITRDETMAQAYIDAGMDPNSVKRFQHVLLNNLGDADQVTAQVYQFTVAPGDHILLCTDGLTNMVVDQEIAAILQQSLIPQIACDSLINAALDKGGRDNITIVLAAVSADTT